MRGFFLPYYPTIHRLKNLNTNKNRDIILSNETLLDGGLKFRSLFFPDKFLAHGKPEDQYEEANLLAKDIVYTALQTLGADTKREIDKSLA